MAALEHPAILPIYHFAERDGVPFFTMKPAGGGALSGRLQEYRGQWKAIAALMRTVAEAVQFAHEHAVFHRDLKPGNLLFDEADRVMVSDFGLAHFEDAVPAERPGGGSGTPGYVAPELGNGGTFTAAADVWSLGAVFRDLLVCAAPGAAETRTSTWPPGAPRDLIAIARKSLSEDPTERYRSAREMAGDLERWQQGRPVLARPVSALRRLAYWAKRNPTAAGCAVILAGALGTFVTLQWRSQSELRAALGESLLLEARHPRVLDPAGRGHGAGAPGLHAAAGHRPPRPPHGSGRAAGPAILVALPPLVRAVRGVDRTGGLFSRSGPLRGRGPRRRLYHL